MFSEGWWNFWFCCRTWKQHPFPPVAWLECCSFDRVGLIFYPVRMCSRPGAVHICATKITHLGPELWLFNLYVEALISCDSPCMQLPYQLAFISHSISEAVARWLHPLHINAREKVRCMQCSQDDHEVAKAHSYSIQVCHEYSYS